MARSTARRYREDIIAKSNILGTPTVKAKGTHWTSRAVLRSLLWCPECSATQSVESFDSTTKMATLSCGHSRGASAV